jgi:hypothetical protein
MKWIKTFETFDFGQTIPVVSKSDLTNYYHCDDCDALWKVLNQEASMCKFCNSESIEELSKDEWFETVGNRLDEDEVEDLESEKSEEEGTFIDLYKLKRGYVN